MSIQVSPYQAVKIKYLSPTNTKGARLKCVARIASATYDYHACDGDPAIALERFLAEKCAHWNNRHKHWVIGLMPDTNRSVWLAVSCGVQS